MSAEYEEHREMSARRSWMLIILLCVVIVVWGILNYLLIPDTPRRWDNGALRDVPAESVYSTSEPAPGATPARQIAPLPEAKPLKPEKK